MASTNAVTYDNILLSPQSPDSEPASLSSSDYCIETYLVMISMVLAHPTRSHVLLFLALTNLQLKAKIAFIFRGFGHATYEVFVLKLMKSQKL